MDHQSKPQHRDAQPVNSGENTSVNGGVARLDVPVAHSVKGLPDNKQISRMKAVLEQLVNSNSGIDFSEILRARKAHDVDMVLRTLDVQMALKYRKITHDLHQRLLKMGADQDEATDKLAMTICRWAFHLSVSKPDSYDKPLDVKALHRVPAERVSEMQAIPWESLTSSASCDSNEQQATGIAERVESVVNKVKEQQAEEKQSDTADLEATSVRNNRETVDADMETISPDAADEEDGSLLDSSEAYHKALQILSMKETELAQAQGKINSLNQTIKQLGEVQNEYQHIAHERKQLVVALNSSETKRAAQEKGLVDYISTVNTLENTIQSLKENLDECKKEFEVSLGEYKEQLKTLSVELDDNNTVLMAKNNDICQLYEKLAGKDLLIEHQKNYIHDLKEELNSLDIKMTEHNQISERLLENKEKEILKLCASLQTSEEQINILRKVIKSKRKQKSDH